MITQKDIEAFEEYNKPDIKAAVAAYMESVYKERNPRSIYISSSGGVFACLDGRKDKRSFIVRINDADE